MIRRWNIEIDNKFESDLREIDTVLPNIHIKLLWNIQRVITHLTSPKHQIITFNIKVIKFFL
jgi:hypothetical protein